jgi:hypothetical protein
MPSLYKDDGYKDNGYKDDGRRRAVTLTQELKSKHKADWSL